MSRLVLTRRPGEVIDVKGPCRIEVTEAANGRCRLAITAERSVKILRGELQPHEQAIADDQAVDRIAEQIAAEGSEP